MIFPILVYFFFFDRKRIINGCVKIIPGDRKMLSKVWLEMDTQLSNYIRGKVVEIVIVGTAAAILFGSFGLNYAALLAVLVGLSVLIPFVGAFAVTIPIVIIGLIQFGLGTQFYLLIGLYLFLQFLDGNLLVPIIFIIASILLISTIPTYSFKKIVIQRSMTKFLLFGIVLFFGALLVYTFKVLAVSSAIYLCLIPISYFHYKKIKKEKNITSDKDEGLEDIL